MTVEKYDFGGYATRNDLECADGRIIRKNAFKSCDGIKVPLVWNHDHKTADNILGHAYLENREDGVYAYGIFNDTPEGKRAKELVKHGDVTALSIYANKLKQHGGDVLHGIIKEVSLVWAGANPGAFIDSIMIHGEGIDDEDFEEAFIIHSEDGAIDDFGGELVFEDDEDNISHANEDEHESSDKTIGDVLDTLSDEQKTAVYAVVGAIMEKKEDSDKGSGGSGKETSDNIEHSDGGSGMKTNLFDNTGEDNAAHLSHADQMAIIADAKKSGVGSLRQAISIYAANSKDEALQHSIADGDIIKLFPEYDDVYKGEPNTITRDMTWVEGVINGAHKSPISRIRTRHADARQTGIRARGYKKGAQKKEMGNINLLSRTTDPQTVYVKDKLNRDDIVDIVDFDVVKYQYKLMEGSLHEELAIAIMVGDGREDGAEDKIDESHIRSIWHDNDLYTIHQDVNIAKAKSEIQGTDTAKNFGMNYIYAEAIIEAALKARESYKGSGSLAFYCTPHLVNVMLLARDMNGRRIYESKSDLAAALDVSAIYTAEQFEGLTRTTSDSKKKQLLGIFVNMADYQIGATKGGEITRFNQFDIDFNQEKYLIETRVSGALIKIYSAIAIEEDVTDASSELAAG